MIHYARWTGKKCGIGRATPFAKMVSCCFKFAEQPLEPESAYEWMLKAQRNIEDTGAHPSSS